MSLASTSEDFMVTCIRALHFMPEYLTANMALEIKKMHCRIVDMKSEYSCSFFMQQMLLNMLRRVMYWFRFLGKDKNMIRRVKFKDDCKQSCWLYLCFVLVALESNISSLLTKCIFRCNSLKVLDYEHFLYPNWTFFISISFCMNPLFFVTVGPVHFQNHHAHHGCEFVWLEG